MRQFWTALKFSAKEQSSNRFALGLLVLFVPLWFWLLGVITPADQVAFRFAPTGGFLQANGHDLVLLTAGLNVLSMIIGFMFFHSSHKSLPFDRRLTSAGLNRVALVAAKAASLLLTAAVLALYTLLILLAFWHNPINITQIWLGFLMVSLIYGSFGILLGMLLSSELAGFFIVIMLSQIDVFLQIPIANPAANKAFLVYLPSYGAVQLSVAGGFSHLFASRQLLMALGWLFGFLIIAFGIFYLRTRRQSGLVTKV